MLHMYILFIVVTKCCEKRSCSLFIFMLKTKKYRPIYVFIQLEYYWCYRHVSLFLHPSFNTIKYPYILTSITFQQCLLIHKNIAIFMTRQFDILVCHVTTDCTNSHRTLF